MGKSLKALITKAVKEASNVAPGGVKYFDALDESIYTNPDILDALLDHIKVNYTEGQTLILSGHFGKAFIERHEDILPSLKFGYLLMTGGLRKDDAPKIINWGRIYMKGLLIDDSSYSYTTLVKMHYVVISNGMYVNQALVLYDGGKKPKPSIFQLNSFYEYYTIRKNN